MSKGFDLTGRRILLTGAAGGIGRATARVLRGQGASLVLCDRLKPPLDDQLVLAGDIELCACDVSNRSEVEKLAASHDNIDALVLSAGILPFDDWMAADWDESFDRVIDVNVKGVLNFARAFLPQMISRRDGRIVVLGSASGRMGGMQAGPHYVASKGAVHALVRWLAMRGAPHKVLVNGVAPGSVATDLLLGQPFNAARVPLGRMAEPEEIAWPIAFLCSPASSFMCGAVVDINGGLIFS